jgi:glutaredoxin 3
MINVYGKQDCTYCAAAKNLLESKNIPYNYFNVGEDVGIDFVIENFPGIRTVPIVQVNGKHIGGYDELKEYLEEISGGHADHI